MIDQINQTLTLVKDTTDAHAMWPHLIDICRRVHPDLPWHEMPSPEVQLDLHEAWLWLQNDLSEHDEAVGIYLGLDTLNMQGGRGTNIEFGATSECDPNSGRPDWAWDAALRYGSRHLIKGLVGMQACYSRPAWRESSGLCDYVFFLGYSGMVLAEVFESFTLPRTLMPVWGFHGGDLFTLGRYQSGEFTRLCAG